VFFFALPNETQTRLLKLQSQRPVVYVSLQAHKHRASVQSALQCPVDSRLVESRSPRFLVLRAGETPRVRRTVYLNAGQTLEEELAEAPFDSWVFETGPNGEPRARRIVRRVTWKSRLRNGLFCAAHKLGIRLPGMAVRYEVIPEDHPTGILFGPGGIREDGVVLSGEIRPVSERPDSIDLFQLFGRELCRDFKELQGYMLSPGALEALATGVRLTDDSDAAPERDLRVTNAADE